MKKIALTTSLALCISAPLVSNAAVLCDNCTLSTSAAAPTAYTFAAGDNHINVKLQPQPTGGNPAATTAIADARYFSFTIPSGFGITEIKLESFSSTQVAQVATANSTAFFGIKAGSPITPSVADPSVVDGYALLGTTASFANGVDSTLVGQSLFPSFFVSSAITGKNFTERLVAGTTYYVWLRESRTADTLSLNFKVTPAPIRSNAIPTLSEWGTIFLTGLLAFFGLRRSKELLLKR